MDKSVLPNTRCPSISVIVRLQPKGCDCLGQTIQSVVEQDFADWELLVVPASGTGKLFGTAQKVVRALGPPDSRITVLPVPGAAGPICAGLKKSTGHYIAFLDSGDLYPSKCLSALYSQIQIFDRVDIAFCQLAGPGKSSQDSAVWSQMREQVFGELLLPQTGRVMRDRSQQENLRYLEFYGLRSCLRHRRSNRPWSRLTSFYGLYGLDAGPQHRLYRRDFLQQHLDQLAKVESQDILHWQTFLSATDILFCESESPSTAQAATAQAAKQSEAAEQQGISAKRLLYAEPLLDYLLHTQPKLADAKRQSSGTEFYLLLWLRNLLANLCLELPLDLLQWQELFLATEQLLRRRMRQSPLLARTLQPLHRLKCADFKALRLSLLEIVTWTLLLRRVRAVRTSAQCSRPVKLLGKILQSLGRP